MGHGCACRYIFGEGALVCGGVSAQALDPDWGTLTASSCARSPSERCEKGGGRDMRKICWRGIDGMF